MIFFVTTRFVASSAYTALSFCTFAAMIERLQSHSSSVWTEAQETSERVGSLAPPVHIHQKLTEQLTSSART
jgi:hypothetical protein